MSIQSPETIKGLKIQEEALGKYNLEVRYMPSIGNPFGSIGSGTSNMTAASYNLTVKDEKGNLQEYKLMRSPIELRKTADGYDLKLGSVLATAFRRELSTFGQGYNPSLLDEDDEFMQGYLDFLDREPNSSNVNTAEEYLDILEDTKNRAENLQALGHDTGSYTESVSKVLEPSSPT